MLTMNGMNELTCTHAQATEHLVIQLVLQGYLRLHYVQTSYAANGYVMKGRKALQVNDEMQLNLVFPPREEVQKYVEGCWCWCWCYADLANLSR